MLWSFVKFAVFLVIVAALAWGVSFVIETGGEVRIAFGATEISLSPLMALLLIAAAFVGVWLLIKLAGFIVALLRFVNGDDTALSRYFDRNREKRGYKALEEGVIALAAGDGKTALKRATKADRLLDKPHVTQLVSAQAAQIAGDKARATEHFKALLKHDDTRFVGIRGLLQQKLDEGDTDTALALAQKAFQTDPGHDQNLETLFLLQSEKKDWKGARETLQARVRNKTLPKDLGARRDAVLRLADALSAEEEPARREAALEANRLAPGLIPAAALAARELIAAKDTKKAARVLKKAWEQNPHPDLAAAFAEIAPGESPEARLRRFRPLLAIKPEATETRLLEAELYLSAEDFPAARKALGDLATADPTARSLSIMAAIERGQGAEEAVVSGWLARAVAAPRGDAWVCGNCKHIEGHWEPLCENCGGFDTLSWTRVPQSEDAHAMAAAMLPLLAGAPARAEPEPEGEVVDAEEAETVPEPEQKAS